MNLRKLTLTYLVSYLFIGGLGFAFFPSEVLQLFQSNTDYGDIMPRVVGMFMTVLGFLIFRILKNEDWKYYPFTIYARSGITLFLIWMYTKTNDPLWIVLIGIVLLGLIPSAWVHFFKKI